MKIKQPSFYLFLLNKIFVLICQKYMYTTLWIIIHTLQISGLPYAEKTADYYADDYNYSSDDYPNGDGDDNLQNHLGDDEKPIHVNPKMISKDSDELINEGDIIKLPCVVDTLGRF